MPALAVGILLIQIFFAVHAVRSGKETFWLYIIFMFPGIGSAIYFFTQYAPEKFNRGSRDLVKNTLLKAVDPQRELKIRTEQLEIANTVENRLALADECVDALMYAEAIALLEAALSGVHASDPRVLSRLARTHFEAGHPAKTIEILEDLIEKNPSYQSPDEHLLFARALAADNRKTEACAEYDVLRQSFPGEEARVRYAELLKEMEQPERAAELFAEARLRAKRAPKHYRKREKHWLQMAERG